MIYEYKCEACEEITTIELSMQETIPKTIKCEHCAKKASRVWGNSTIKIPEHMKACSDICGGDNYANLDNLKSSFKHSHPSGRGKIYY